MSAGYVTKRRVEFRDTDAAGIVHFSVFFLWMEEVEHEALRHLGLSVHQPGEQHVVSFPRASATCDFLAPARFEDELDVVVTIPRIGTKSVTYEFTFRSGDTTIAKGQVTTVCCEVQSGGILRSTPIPPDILTRLQRLVPQKNG